MIRIFLDTEKMTVVSTDNYFIIRHFNTVVDGEKKTMFKYLL